jgi:hypothetical protein
MHFKTGRKPSSSDDCERITGYARLTLLRVAHELAPKATRIPNSRHCKFLSKAADQFEDAKMPSAARKVGRH